MKVCGIIAEYNPFHNGHAYQLQAARQSGATHVVCVLSGNFTQRGDAAMMDKLSRARCALAAGADLVVELPVVYALSSAEGFARGGVALLQAMGCVDTLHFGSECGDVNALLSAADAITRLDARRLIDPSAGSSAAARSAALRENGFAAQADLLESPNNLLGVEYLLALRRCFSHITPQTVRRVGAQHDAAAPSGDYCSASQLRRLLTASDGDGSAFLPDSTLKILMEERKAGKAPMDLHRIETALLSRLRMADARYFERIAGVSEGLENRIAEAVRTAKSFDDLCAAVKTKRYPLSRIRRILLCAAIGITKKDAALFPAYLRVLGQTERGNEVLRRMRTAATLPVVMRTSDLDALPPEGKRLFHLESAATDLYVMGHTPMGDCATEYTRNIYSITKG